MKVLIAGAGAMGSRYGIALHRSGWDVTLFDVNREHTSAITANGLEVRSDGKIEHVGIKAVSDITGTGSFDYVFIFTKAMYTASVLRTILPILNEKTILVTLQNGLGNIDTLKSFAPASPVIAGITNYAAAYLAPGCIEANGSGITKIQAIAGAEPSSATVLAAALEAGGIHTSTVDDIEHHIWAKVAFNAALNTVTTLTGLSVGGVGGTSEALETAFLVAKDVAKVARSVGITLTDDEACDSIRSVMTPGMSSTHYPSMFQDVKAGRKTEIDCICGKVLEKGNSTGTDAPYLRAVYNLIRAIESNFPKRIL